MILVSFFFLILCLNWYFSGFFCVCEGGDGVGYSGSSHARVSNEQKSDDADGKKVSHDGAAKDSDVNEYV